MFYLFIYWKILQSSLLSATFYHKGQLLEIAHLFAKDKCIIYLAIFKYFDVSEPLCGT